MEINADSTAAEVGKVCVQAYHDRNIDGFGVILEAVGDSHKALIDTWKDRTVEIIRSEPEAPKMDDPPQPSPPSNPDDSPADDPTPPPPPNDPLLESLTASGKPRPTNGRRKKKTDET